MNVGTLIRSAGGMWNKQKKLWQLPYGEVEVLGLQARIVKNGK